MSVNKRVDELFSTTGLSNIEIAKRMGYENARSGASMISSIRKTKDIGAITIRRIKKCFPKLDVDWLVYGTGTMFLDNNIVNEKQAVYGGNKSELYDKALELLAEQLDKKDAQIERLLDIITKK